MPIPLNIQTFLDTVRGVAKPINANSLTREELDALRYVIQRRQQANKDREFDVTNRLYDTAQEYRRGPDTKLYPETEGSTRLVSRDVPYNERQNDLRRQKASFNIDRSKTSVSYGDYDVKSGENAAPVGQGWSSAIQQSMNDPLFRLAGTLGSFNAYDRGDHYEVQDKYKFNKEQQGFYRGAADKSLGHILKNYYDQPGSLGEILFRKYLGDRSRDVNIKVKK